MSKSEIDLRGARDETFRQLLEDCEGEEARVFMCRGDYDHCRKHIEGRRKTGEPACQWCASAFIDEHTTVEDLQRAIALNA